jgi:hypothetical protein
LVFIIFFGGHLAAVDLAGKKHLTGLFVLDRVLILADGKSSWSLKTK